MACTPRARDFGYAPDDAALSEIVVGSDTSSRVEELVGRPGTAGVVGESAWYYIASRQETVLWRAPEITDRQVVAISFDDAGTVRNVERFTLEDGRVVALSRRVTDDNTTGISFLRQLLGNLGNFTADQFVEP
ncbi:MAG: outer membrane protein assembly factor BamE [Pseudomonadota bacterium]